MFTVCFSYLPGYKLINLFNSADLNFNASVYNFVSFSVCSPTTSVQHICRYYFSSATLERGGPQAAPRTVVRLTSHSGRSTPTLKLNMTSPQGLVGVGAEPDVSPRLHHRIPIDFRTSGASEAVQIIAFVLTLPFLAQSCAWCPSRLTKVCRGYRLRIHFISKGVHFHPFLKNLASGETWRRVFRSSKPQGKQKITSPAGQVRY